MTWLALLPVCIAALLMGAHFLHAGNVWAVAFSLLFPGLLFFRQRWAARTVQVLLVLAGAEWVRRLFELVRIYQEAGKPCTRMVIILSTVAVLTAGAALVFLSRSLKDRYNLNAPQADRTPCT